jgi:guanosine-3',5'-bis(diphosphate) 3'-pyrophosphohydrolase
MRSGESEQSFLLRALDFAARKHRDQRRKGSEAPPYINHPISVARVLAEVGGVIDPVTLAGALLHDTVEDTETTLEEIEAEFGAEVRRLVAEVTDDKSLPRSERKRLQVERTPVASDRAKLVKMGDKICNLTDLVHAPPVGWSRERQVDYLNWTLQVAAGCRGVNPALDELYDRVFRESRAALTDGT